MAPPADPHPGERARQCGVRSHRLSWVCGPLRHRLLPSRMQNITVGALHLATAAAKNNLWESVLLMSASQVDPGGVKNRRFCLAVGARYKRNRGMLWCFRGRYFRVAHSRHDALGAVTKWVEILSHCFIVVNTFLLVFLRLFCRLCHFYYESPQSGFMWEANLNFNWVDT